MTPNKQVSPVIRISRGERDASARATHLEAATRKFLVTTNERKYMSTTTNFKRIALVAVAALGLGVLSSVPSQAAVTSTITLTPTNGTATIISADSRTAGSVYVRFLATGTDSVTVTATLDTKPVGATDAKLSFTHVDTSTSTGTSQLVGIWPTEATSYAPDAALAYKNKDTFVVTSSVSGYASGTFKAQIDSTVARVAGTYTYTLSATPWVPNTVGNSAPDYTKTVTAQYSIVIAALASASTVASAATSKAWLSTTAANTAATTDSVPSVLATVSSTDAPRAYIYTALLNAYSNATDESVTVTTTLGQVGTSASRGKSVVVATSSGVVDVKIWSDGTAGTATITIKSTSVTFANKSIVFYAAAPTSIVASALNDSPGISSTPAALSVVAKDANGNLYGGSLYVSSDALTVISDTATACTYNTTNSRHECSLTGLTAGTAKITVRDAATAPTVSSNAVSFTVSSSSAAQVKLAFDKASYAPGEKATLLITVVDSAGKSLPAGTFSNLFATGGITLSTAAGNGSDTVTAVSATTVSLASYALGTLTTPVKAYTIYMPTSGGTFKATATGGSSVALAGQVAVSASATVTDSGAAALAAVTALATTVASLKTLITTLTNLVLKIQKKVKA